METDDSQRVEQITDDSIIQIPEDLRGAKKVKDSRKVPAVKALITGNVKRRNQKKRTSENEEKESESYLKVEMSTIYDVIQKSAVLVGAGFTLYHGYNFFKEKQDLYSRATPESTTPESPTPESPTPESTTPESPTRRNVSNSIDLDF